MYVPHSRLRFVRWILITHADPECAMIIGPRSHGIDLIFPFDLYPKLSSSKSFAAVTFDSKSYLALAMQAQKADVFMQPAHASLPVPQAEAKLWTYSSST